MYKEIKKKVKRSLKKISGIRNVKEKCKIIKMFADVKLLQINFLPTSEISPIHKMLSFYNNLGEVDCVLMWTLFLLKHLQKFC